MGNGGEGGDKDRGNGAGAGYAVQGSHAVSVVIWELEFVADGGHAKSARAIPLSGNKKDCGDGSAAYNKRGVGFSTGG